MGVVVRILVSMLLSELASYSVSFLVGMGKQPGPRFVLHRRPVFSGCDVEDTLLMVGTCFGMYALARSIPNGFDDAGLMQPELCAIMCAAFFGNAMTLERRHAVELILAKFWVACSVVLFPILGSKVSFKILGSMVLVVAPLLLSGWCLRGGAVTLLISLTRHKRTCTGGRCEQCLADNNANWKREAAFALLVGVPRATIQGALAYSCAQEHAFESFEPLADAQRSQNKIAELAICTLALCAPLGVLVLDLVAKPLLKGCRRECAVALQTHDLALESPTWRNRCIDQAAPTRELSSQTLGSNRRRMSSPLFGPHSSDLLDHPSN